MRLRKEQYGFSLLEVLIATALFIMTSGAVLQVFSSASKMVGPEKAVAHNWGRRHMEWLQSMTRQDLWDNVNRGTIALMSNPLSLTLAPQNMMNFEFSDTRYNIEYSGSSVTGRAYRKVRVRSAWAAV